MSPWFVLVAFVAAINVLAFIAVRGHWGRLAPLLGVASVGGTMAGDAIGQRTGVDLLRIGDFHVVTASVVAQLAMVAVSLLAALFVSQARAET
jgi:hypothetical protein